MKVETLLKLIKNETSETEDVLARIDKIIEIFNEDNAPDLNFLKPFSERYTFGDISQPTITDK